MARRGVINIIYIGYIKWILALWTYCVFFHPMKVGNRRDDLESVVDKNPRLFHQMSSSWRNSPTLLLLLMEEVPWHRSQGNGAGIWYPIPDHILPGHRLRSEMHLFLSGLIHFFGESLVLKSMTDQMRFCKINGRSQLRLHYCVDGISGGLRVSTLTVVDTKTES